MVPAWRSSRFGAGARLDLLGGRSACRRSATSCSRRSSADDHRAGAHRGAGAFDRARAGIALLRELGFHVRVAATIDAADAAEAAGLHARLDADGVPPGDRLVRPVARTGFADHGMELSIDGLWPEPTLAADGAWWHPVGIAEPSMQVASEPLPLVTTLAVIGATLNDPERDRTTALAAFRCT